jgi:hypothetical protein
MWLEKVGNMKFHGLQIYMCWDNFVSKVTGYRLDNGFDFWKGLGFFLLPPHSYWLEGPPSLLSHDYGDSFPGVKVAGA